MQVAIFGSSGFLGTNLTHYILEHTDWNIRAFSRRGAIQPLSSNQASRVQFIAGSVLEPNDVQTAHANIDIAYYFIHMMGHKDVDFYEAELQAAELFAREASRAKVPRIIYMGGLGRDNAQQSLHLASRHRTGDVLRTSSAQVIELQASMIIGNGSVAFDIIKNIVERLPIMLLPRVSNTLTQPIALSDALAYLVAAAKLTNSQNQTVPIGGQSVLSYADVYKSYANFSHKRRLLIKVPVMSNYVGGNLLDIVTPRVHARIGRAMMDSLATEMVVESDTASKIFPTVHPKSLQIAFKETRP